MGCGFLIYLPYKFLCGIISTVSFGVFIVEDMAKNLMGSANEEFINVCLATDNNYARYAAVTIASILDNALKTDRIRVFVLDGGIDNINKTKILALSEIHPCEINFINVDDNLFNDYKKVKTHGYITLSTFYRLKLPSLLPDVKKIIYFDCDFVVNVSLKPLFNKDLGNFSVAGAKDINKRMLKKNPNYVNAGMLVFDLENMRAIGAEKSLLDWTLENIEKINMGDQQIINEALKGQIMLIEDEWNVQSSNFTNRSSYTSFPKGIHFVSKRKPWHFGSFSYHRNLYFKYLQLTPWRLNDKDFRHWTVDNQIASLFNYVKYRPLFLFRPRFYAAFFKTYVLPFLERFLKPKAPIIKDNTFFLWEPCSKSHSEVLPGYAKYLIDLGYNVSVLLEPKRLKEGLFSRFIDRKTAKHLYFNKMSRAQIKKYFKNNEFGLDKGEGVLVTTVGKLCDSVHYNDTYNNFKDPDRVYFVEHEVKHSADNGSWNPDIITLREVNYKGIESTVVNPHYFGEVKITPKNPDITNFITIGAIQGKKKNNDLIINSVKALHDKGIRNFKVTVIGKGHLKGLPPEIRPYFDIKGRLPFDKMYDEIEKADFLLTSYNKNDPMHIRYNTTGTSGNFQLVYGFLKPVVLIRDFAPINGFNDENSILYEDDKDFCAALECGIRMDGAKYQAMQEKLKEYQQKLYTESLQNLKNLIEKGRKGA